MAHRSLARQSVGSAKAVAVAVNRPRPWRPRLQMAHRSLARQSVGSAKAVAVAAVQKPLPLPRTAHGLGGRGSVHEEARDMKD